MAYNVFKRPMFKRGGSTTGTGIMSHVEPRIMAQGGYPNFGVSQTTVDPITGMTPYEQMLANRQTSTPSNIENIFQGMPTRGSYYTQPQTIEEFYKKRVENMLDIPGILAASPEYKKQFEKSSSEEVIGSGGARSIDEMARINMITEEQAKKSEADKVKTGEKDAPSITTEGVKTLEDEIKSESELIRNLIKDKNYDRGQAALILSAALKEPGTLSDKIAKAVELGGPLAAKKKEEDKAITLAAYKLAKEKEQQQIKAGTLPKELMLVKERARLLAKDKGTTEEEEYKKLILQDVNLDAATQRAVDTFLTPQGIGEKNRIVNDIKNARRRRQEAAAEGKDTKKIDKELSELMSEFETLRSTKGFTIAYPELANFKEGGRVMKAVGGDAETDDIITSQVSFGGENKEDATVVEKPVENLSFAELRDRLPPEITDDVVQMLASSEEALQDFAYIRTQDDINSFNIKYGVNLVIPPTQA